MSDQGGGAVTFTSGDEVAHPRLGMGVVEMDQGAVVLVRFADGIESCLKEELTPRESIATALRADRWSPPLEVITRAQAAAIVSLNDAWGVFSRSRIALLPHQLWVCHQVLGRWPIRHLVADDVGLGKTIEAGLILWPLLSKGYVKRLLILTPASLVVQWQARLREMFDIRLSRYVVEADHPRTDFWNTHNHVVASLPTMRADRSGRHDRLFAAQPWDLLIVDEAHHLNADERQGATLGYELVERLLRQGKATSALFFTGTPHRGKPYAFWSLLELLRPELFGADRDEEDQLRHLSEVLIRNNKQVVVDMEGNRLFKPIRQHPYTYTYSGEEQDFYNLLTDFITSGRAYAASLTGRARQQVMLVLIAMQKLASSSVAAIRKALQGRLARLRDARDRVQAELSRRVSARPAGNIDPEDAILYDLQAAIDETLAQETIQLLENEIPNLERLVEAAEAVEGETKIERILQVVEAEYPRQSVLFFTEYKATQAQLMSGLIERYGDGCVAFINGDERIEGIRLSDGELHTLTEKREDAAERFNRGAVRFLVSTEAGGEGIDLQERCHTLFHVDLPWNPMRLHQRVGRLNRYGQRHTVDVVTLRNEETVEARIWDKLNSKLASIMQALGAAMEEPEDLLQLVLGMSDSSLFNELFAEGTHVRRERLDEWFDQRTRTFGGADVIATVRQLVGHAARFDYRGLGQVPNLDLPDLQPFFEAMLRWNKRRPSREGEHLAFKTPERWLTRPAVRNRYDGVVFSRDVVGRDAAERVIGVGHQAFDRAVEQALEQQAFLAAAPELSGLLIVFQVRDRVTESTGPVREVVLGVLYESGAMPTLLRDGELLRRLNGLDPKAESVQPQCHGADLHGRIEEAQAWIQGQLDELRLPFRVPEVKPLCLISPDGSADTSRVI